ncbi:hypothetical protein RHO12_03365 [Orbus sturtevantii]|uniref:hypothetical protein n=1 Tax=Orbus sturtevantii TaxID=3074109 RepID=UPI00370CFD81
MNKIIILLLSCFLLQGCNAIGNAIHGALTGTDLYRSDVKASHCELENDRCVNEKIIKDSSLVLQIPHSGDYSVYLIDAAYTYVLSTMYMPYDKFNDRFKDILKFVRWADSPESNRENKPNIDYEYFHLYFDNQNTPYIATRNEITSFFSTKYEYVLFDKEQASELLKELLYIKIMLDKIKNKSK